MTIKQEYGMFLSMMFNTLDRKPITNQQDRENYKLVILDYCLELSNMSVLNINNQSPLFNHFEYMKELDRLLVRYKSIGDDIIPDNKLDTFLNKLQNMMRDFLQNDLEEELYKEEKKYYVEGAWKNGSIRGTTSDYTWQEEKSELIKNSFEKYKDGALESLFQKRNQKIEGLG